MAKRGRRHLVPVVPHPASVSSLLSGGSNGRKQATHYSKQTIITYNKETVTLSIWSRMRRTGVIFAARPDHAGTRRNNALRSAFTPKMYRKRRNGASYEFYIPAFGTINEAAHWDYQRDRVT